MYHNNFITAVNTTAQTLAVDNIVSLYELYKCGCAISFGGGTTPIRLRKKGLYLVDATLNLLGTVAGTVTIQMLNNSVPITGALSSITVAAGDEYSVHITALVDVPPSCCCQNNMNNIQLQVLDNPVTVNSVRVDVAKLGCD